jgi:hypothetical protein
VDTAEITRQTIEAWDEVQRESEEPTAEATEEPEEQEEEQPEEETAEETDEAAEGESEEQEEEPAESDEEAEGEGEAEAEGEEGGEEEVEEVTAAYRSDNPQVQAYLDRFQGDVEKALLNEVHLQQVISRHGQERDKLEAQITDLQQELTHLRTFGPGAPLTPEQRDWVEQAVESQNPVAYVQQAIEAEEFDLARAVCDAWAQDAPYEAGRIAQHVDAAQWRQEQMQTQQQPPIDQTALMGVIVEHFPEMPQYEQQMLQTISSLGDNHPLVQDAKSNNPEAAATAIVSIYEIARAQTTSVTNAREKVKRDGRKAADDARTAAVVSSAQATPTPTEPPRRREVMPGLTMEELDSAWK